ncbi:MAG: hypothetical protein B7Z33_10760 [Sphingomonadales bacterium 12-68-11]|nr:MAG: hypothetical protein B7Z33_10760 [Sphingomonadales bacterium 12-68-11]
MVSESRVRRHLGALPARADHRGRSRRQAAGSADPTGPAGARAIHGLIKRTGPAAAPPAKAPASAPVEAGPAPLARDCLVVDDSRMIRKVARQIVEALGYRVEEAENGAEALVLCRAAMPDLILLDWNMPVMSGLDFVAALRLLAGGHKPKVLFCSNEREAANIGKGIAAGADGFVIKPFDAATLHSKLQRIGAA